MFYFARQYDDAVTQYREALELDPNNASVHEYLGDAYEQEGKYDEAVAEWRAAMTLAGDDELAVILGSAYAEEGFSGAVRAVARKRLERSNERAERGEYVLAIDYARAYVRLSDKEQAFKRLVKACEERNRFPLFINTDPFYDSLRADPRFPNRQRAIKAQKTTKAGGCLYYFMALGVDWARHNIDACCYRNRHYCFRSLALSTIRKRKAASFGKAQSNSGCSRPAAKSSGRRLSLIR